MSHLAMYDIHKHIESVAMWLVNIVIYLENYMSQLRFNRHLMDINEH